MIYILYIPIDCSIMYILCHLLYLFYFYFRRSEEGKHGKGSVHKHAREKKTALQQFCFPIIL